jgi:tetratricopeptide (TPR) repeat protein
MRSNLRQPFLVVGLILLSLSPSRAEPARAEPNRLTTSLRGLDFIFNEEFPQAHALFDSLISAEPRRPEGYLGRAMAYWEESMLLAGGEALVTAIHGLIDGAIDAAEGSIRGQGESAEMYFWLGSAYGLRAVVGMTHGDILRGAVDGLRTREALLEAHELDPGLVDVHFGLGLADYVMSRKPKLLRMVSRMLSLPAGDREAGLARLDLVAREGVYCRKHALSSLAYIELYYEKHTEEGRRRFQELIHRYPKSIDYRIRHLDAMLAMSVMGKGRHAEILADSVGSIRDMVSARDWTLEPWTRTKLTFVEGFGHYLTGKAELARERMAAYVEEAEKKSWLLAPAELILGKLADLRGNREEAIGHYRLVRKHEDVWGSHAEADTHLREPFAGEEAMNRPPDMVRRYPKRP